MKKSGCLDPIDTIERIYRPTKEEFESNFFSPQRPCVITGAMDRWKALSLWTVDYLPSTIGNKYVPCRVSSSSYFDNYQQRERIKLSVFFNWLMSETSSQFFNWSGLKPDAKKYFVGSLNIQTLFPELLQDIEFPEYFDCKLLMSTNLWIGQGSNRVNLHYDTFHNLNAQVVGKKRWVIFSPEQSSLLYPHPWYTRFFWCSKVNINQPDLEQFPKFCEARPLEVITEPGEMLFLPAGWWHSPVGIGLNIAVNFWWRSRLREFVSWRLKSILRHLILK